MGQILYITDCFVDKLPFKPDERVNMGKQPFIYKSRQLV
jgi:hypothetical protein